MTHASSATSALHDPAADVFAYNRIQTSEGIVGVRQCGQGPDTVVLLHGISSGADSWRHCAAFLSNDAKVIAWDAPGYGCSDPVSSLQPLATDYAQRLQALLDRLQVHKCMVVGHSLGALMAAGLAHLNDARISQLLLISPALGYGQTERADQVRANRLNALSNKGIEGIAHALPNRLLSEHACATHRAAVTANALKLNEGGYRQAVELLCADDIYCYGNDLPKNTQVYCGDLDVVTTPQQSAGFAQRLGLAFGLIKNAGHACYIEQPGQVASLVRHILALQKGVA